MFKSILVAYDGSTPARACAKLAAACASRWHARIALCCALDEERLLVPAVSQPASTFDVLETYRRETADVLIEQLQECRREGIDCETMLREEGSREGILRAAAEMPADLIAIGTHGRSGFGRALLGSVTEDILRHSTLPVLTVREMPERLEPFRRIVVALDGSVCAVRAFEAATEIARTDGARLEPVHIEPGAEDVGLAICGFAERTKADLVAIGSHGREGLARMFLGSIAETVVRNAPCPVLVTRA
jgi:nucleotide-binding universal stress UspA family protein